MYSLVPLGYCPVKNSSSLLPKRHGLLSKEVNNALISETGGNFCGQCCAFVTVPLFRGAGGRRAGRVNGSERAISAVECGGKAFARSEEHTSGLPSLIRISSAVVCLKKKNTP